MSRAGYRGAARVTLIRSSPPRAARPCVYARAPDHFPRAPGKRTSGQMARFSLFQKKSPIRDGIGMTIRRRDAVRFLRARR
jgi:hypothetical protein